MRQPKPYFKASHGNWYANIGPGRRPVKLAEGQDNEKAAWDKYYTLMSDRQPVGEKCLVTDVARIFTEFHRANSSPRTFDFYFDPLDSFVTFLDDLKPRMLVADLRPYHITQWIETRRLSRRSRRVKGTNEYLTSETDRPISQNHRRNLIRAVKAAFKWAEEQEHIDRSPIRHVKVPAAVPRRPGRSLAVLGPTKDFLSRPDCSSAVWKTMVRWSRLAEPIAAAVVVPLIWELVTDA